MDPVQTIDEIERLERVFAVQRMRRCLQSIASVFMSD
jgi:hypothetical protein